MLQSERSLVAKDLFWGSWTLIGESPWRKDSDICGLQGHRFRVQALRAKAFGI